MDSESELMRDDRLGHDGKAHDVLMPMVMEKEDLRGVMSNSESLGVGGGGGGGKEEGEGEEGEEDVLLLKL